MTSQPRKAAGSGRFDLTGRLALVTGSARGLGNSYARALAGAGCDVIVHGSNSSLPRAEQQAAEIAGEFGVTAHAIAFDVTDADAVDGNLAGLMAEWGVPDILVNNAGIQRRGLFTELERSDWDAVIATNLSSVFYVSQPIARRMAERGSGKIVNIGSVTSSLARATVSPYGASKGGVVMLTRSMAADLAPFNIQVNMISPGYFRTELNTALTSDPQFNAWVENRTPAGRWGEVDELGAALVFLCSPGADFVTGQNIYVDGGMTTSL